MQRTSSLSLVRALLNALQTTNLESSLSKAKNFKSIATHVPPMTEFLPRNIIDSLNEILVMGSGATITKENISAALTKNNSFEAKLILDNFEKLVSILTVLNDKNIRLNSSTSTSQFTKDYISKLEGQKKNILQIYQKKLDDEKVEADKNTGELGGIIKSLRTQLLIDIQQAILKENKKIENEKNNNSKGWFTSTPKEPSTWILSVLQKKQKEISENYSESEIDNQLLSYESKKKLIEKFLEFCLNASTYTATDYKEFMNSLKMWENKLSTQKKLATTYAALEENKTTPTVVKISIFREKDKSVPQMSDEEQKEYDDELTRIMGLLNNYLLYLYNKLKTPKITSLEGVQLQTLDQEIQKNYETNQTSKKALKWRKYMIVRKLQGILENKEDISYNKINKFLDELGEYSDEMIVQRGIKKKSEGEKLLTAIFAPYVTPKKTSSNDSSFTSNKKNSR